MDSTIGKQAVTLQSRKNLAILILITGILLPFVARIPSLFLKGTEFYAQYFYPFSGSIFIVLSNSVPFVVIALLLFTKRRKAVLASFIIISTVDIFFHYNLDLTSSSTAGVALIFIPIWLTLLAIVCFGLGLLIKEGGVKKDIPSTPPTTP